IGAGPVGSQIARVLVESGLGTLHVYDNEPPDVARYPSAGVLTSRAEALRAALAGSGSTISPLGHWSKPDAAPLDLTILACDSPELDRVMTDHLLRIDQPHLLVRCWGNGVSVGPLVLAGQTSCLRCADLARSDADPQWPVVLSQLSRLRLESPPALLAWAASVAAAQALAFLLGEVPESAGATLELSWPDFVTRLRRWPAHPGCGCGWLSHTE
ncbi:MAG: ThiF family adenylyltransferase, partial [Propionibacteriaceae bacterium]